MVTHVICILEVQGQFVKEIADIRQLVLQSKASGHCLLILDVSYVRYCKITSFLTDETNND